MTSSTGFVAYYRVSTDRQGESGLGLEAQRAAVTRYLGSASLLEQFTEIESGRKHTNRPQLAAALAECRRRRATLIIATLDRLARNVHFISGLMETGVPFVAADAPEDSPFVLHMRAAMAEEEARKISHRTKVALQAAKARGKRLGNPRWSDSLPRARAARNPDPAPQVVQLVKSHRAQGLTLRAIAAQLNGIGLTTPRGRQWHPETIRSVLNRCEKVTP
jgi:DNA invertase Pin-like site-specific DNA recombinase